MSGSDPSKAYPQPGGLTVSGGAAPVFADLAELRAVAHALRRAAGALEDAVEHVNDGWNAARAGSGVSPDTAHAVQGVLWPVMNGSTALVVGATKLRSLARGLEKSAAHYDDAEAGASAAFRGGLIVAGHVAGENPLTMLFAARLVVPTLVTFGLAAVGWQALQGRPLPDYKALAAELNVENAMAGVGAFLHALRPGRQLPQADPAQDAARVLLNGVAIASVYIPELRPRPLQVAMNPDRASDAPAATNPAQMMAGVGRNYNTKGAPAGTVGVDLVDHRDGTRSFLVELPGTEELGQLGQGSNMFDMNTNLRLMAHVPDPSSELVQRALVLAGAKPGDKVVLAGHSQGGMVVLELASAAAFTAKYNVVGVITAGAPASAARVPERIPTLQVENRPDPVWATDGKRSAASPTHVVVRADLAQASHPADRSAARDPIAAHEVDGYVRTLEEASASGNGSVRAFEEAIAPAMGGPGTTTKHMEFVGTRVDPK